MCICNIHLLFSHHTQTTHWNIPSKSSDLSDDDDSGKNSVLIETFHQFNELTNKTFQMTLYDWEAFK